MTTRTTNTSIARDRCSASRRRRSMRFALLPLAAVTTACGADRFASAGGGETDAAPVAEHHAPGHGMSSQDRATAMLATAGYQDVATAEDDGYGSSIDTLGCFQDPSKGGMGLHYVNEELLDATLDPTEPEALVYELGLDGESIGLVAHEYIVPIDAWTSHDPPRVFGMQLHRHATLPLWVLHTWLWKDNPRGVFEDWNPAVRLCPSGVPIFGVDLPAPSRGS